MPEEISILLVADRNVKKVVQQGRSDFGARSVLPVREHGKMARTTLADFFNIPFRQFETPDVLRHPCQALTRTLRPPDRGDNPRASAIPQPNHLAGKFRSL